jgi:hypothetical protein
VSITRFETVTPDEASLTNAIEALMKQKMERDYAVGNTKRGSQPKTTALLQAQFSVEADIPEELKVGLFRHAKTYSAWIRMGNSHDRPQSDKKKDIRCFSIKVMEAEGRKFDKAQETQTHDFIMISMPMMPIGTLKAFHEAIHYSVKWSPLVFVLRLLFSGRVKVLKEVSKNKINQTSPLDIRYWSTTPSLFGSEKVVKYSVVPTSTYKSSLPAELTDSYLSENMEKHLAEHEASFDFMIQFQKDPALMPVEDASVEWKEQDSPFVKVATIRIPSQSFRTTERNDQVEEFSFSPAQALVEHQPIGSLNRARVELYWRLSEFRHKRDNRKMQEPKA